MGGLAVGPLVFSADRAPVVAALIVFLIAAALLGRGRGGRVGDWAVLASFGALIGARLGFVATNLPVFMDHPASVFAIWQGGFSPVGGLIGFALATLWHFRQQRQGAVQAGIAALLALVAWNVVAELSAPALEAMPENLQLARMDGTSVDASTWQGQPMVLNLWASWCPPCRREMPMMVDVAKAESDVAIHFVNQGEGPEAIRKFLAQAGLVMDPVLDNGQQMMRHFDAMGLPATLFITADGRVQRTHMGEISRAGLLAGIAEIRAN